MRRLVFIFALLSLLGGGVLLSRLRSDARLETTAPGRHVLSGSLQIHGQTLPVQAELRGASAQAQAEELLATLRGALFAQDASSWESNLASAARALEQRLGDTELERLAVGGRDSDFGFASGSERSALPSAAGLRPVLLVGIDAADWQVIEPLLFSGQLPNIAALYRQGAHATLRGQRPLLSPLLWTTIATGVDPFEHGIKDFVAGGAPVPSSARRVPAFWNRFSALGAASTTVAWWATWPAEWVRGSLISDRVAYSLFDAERPADREIAHPAALGPRAAKTASEALVPDALLERFVRVPAAQLAEARRLEASGDLRDPLAHLIRTLRAMRAYHALALQLLEDRPAPVAAVYYQAVDEVCHRFAAARAPALPGQEPLEASHGGAVDAIYRYQDELLGELWSRFRDTQGPESRLLVVSDHGFFTGVDRPRNLDPFAPQTASLWHRPEGIFLAAGEGITPGQRPDLEQTQVLPILLAAAGIAPPAQLAGRVPVGLLAAAPDPVPWPDLVLQRIAAPEPTEESETADAQRLEELRRLGYLGDGPAQGASVNATLVDALHFERAGQKDKALDLLRAALPATGQDETVALAAVNLALELGRFTDADALLQGIEDRGQAQEILPVLRGAAWRGLKLPAAEVLARLEPLRATSPFAGSLARLDLALEAGGPAIDGALREALAMEPESPLLAARLDRLPRPASPEAVAAVASVYQARPQAAKLGRWLARELLDSGRAADARRVFERLLQAEPADRELIERWATAALMSGDAAAVLRELEAVGRADAHTSGTRAVLATAYALAGRAEEAVAEYRRLLADEPDHVELYRPLAQLLIQAGRRKEALELIDRGLGLARGKPEEAGLQALRTQAAAPGGP